MTISINLKSTIDNFNMDVSFTSEARRIGILGASGAGKSMLLKYIAGIEDPLEGKIEVGDMCVFHSDKKIDMKPQQRNIAYMFQSYALFPTMTVRENINVIAKGSKEEKGQKTEFLLKKLHIETLGGKYPGELSGGQQQRVALGRILAYEPKLILLDEPFSALDENLKEKLQIELEEIIADYNGMVVFVSHNRDEIYRFSDELLIMSKGKSVEYGKTKEVFRSPKTLEGAKMVGIDNILPAKISGQGLVEIPDWNIQVDMAREIKGNIKYSGFRDIDLEPVWNDETVENSIEINISRTVEKIKGKKIYFTVGTQNTKEYSFDLRSKEEEKQGNSKLPTKLKINKEKIVLF